eukprot:8504-Heterococcus_DN1.PRE.2
MPVAAVLLQCYCAPRLTQDTVRQSTHSVAEHSDTNALLAGQHNQQCTHSKQCTNKIILRTASSVRENVLIAISYTVSPAPPALMLRTRIYPTDCPARVQHLHRKTLLYN